MTQPMKTATRTKKTVQPMKTALAPTQPMKTEPSIQNNSPEKYKQETMDNKASNKTSGMGAAEETIILDTIENDIAASTTDTN